MKTDSNVLEDVSGVDQDESPSFFDVDGFVDILVY